MTWAARFGIEPQVIDDTLYDAFGQRQITQDFSQANSYHLTPEAPPDMVGDPATLDKLYVRSPSTGQAVPLSTFVHWSTFLSLYLQQVRGYSPIRAGLAFLPMTLCIVATTTIVSRAVTRVGPKPLLVAGMTMVAIGLLLFTQLSATGTYVGEILAPSLLVAIGLGFAFVPVTIAAVAGVDHEEAGLASGLVNTSRLFGGALGLAILAALATSRTNADLHHAASNSAQAMHAALTSGFQLAFLISGLFAATGAVIALFGLPRVATTDGELVGEQEALVAGH